MRSPVVIRPQADVALLVFLFVVVAEGIAARVPPSQWQEVVDTLVAHIRNGRVVDGFIAAIELCGNTLSTNFPRTETSRDELPDRIYLV